MNLTQQTLLKILTESIHKKKYEIGTLNNIDFKELFRLSVDHNIVSLIYYGLSRTEIIKKIPGEVINDFKKSTFFASSYQLKHVKNITKLLDEFSKNDVEVVILKGLVVRNFYPRPEFRTMSDADIVVKEDKLSEAINLIEKLGYIETGRSDVDIGFTNGDSRVELHWNLISKDKLKGGEEFEKQIWNNLIEVEVEGSKALSLNYEDLAVHLMVHLLKHLSYKGCGIRYFCDIVLIFENKQDEINMDSFMNKIREYNLEKSTKIILYICKRYLGMDINYSIDIEDKINEEYLQLLMDDILNHGVFGKSNKKEEVARSLAFYSENELSPIKKYIRVFIPEKEKIMINYPYSNKYKILLPIAYVHRLIKWSLDKNVAIDNKKAICTKGLSIIKERKPIMDWLEL